MIDSVNIQNYKRFEDLQLNELKHLNLLVGENGIGKTSILEAITLAADGKNPRNFLNVLNSRRHYASKEDEVIKSIFSGMSVKTSQENHPIISAQYDEGSNPGKYQFSFYTTEKATSYNYNNGEVVESTFEILYKHPSHKDSSGEHKVQVLTGGGNIRFGDVPNCSICLNAAFMPFGISSAPVFVDVLSDIQLNKKKYNQLLARLKLIQPSIENFNVNGESISVFIENEDRALPISALGTGFVRLFEILVCMSVSPNVLLLDEIDSGIHYSVMPKVWQIIFDHARELKIQVFATTHSYDCVRAFAKVANENPAEGSVIRLKNLGGEIIQTNFDEEDLSVVDELNLELR